jgi:geranylgeranyl diphosphate synthase, type I
VAVNELRQWERVDPRTVVEQRLQALLFEQDEEFLDPTWTRAQALVRDLALRPAKRLRPELLLQGYRLAGEPDQVPDGFWTFATGLEVLHTFMLVHDDVADQAGVRRGGPSLHRSLGGGRLGENLAVVAGDHLFARAMELLFAAPLPTAPGAASFYLRICRQTAVGQYLDLGLAARPWAEVTPFDALKVAELKTAQYTVAAPLACGAMLAGAPPPWVETLQRVGRFAGVAFQLQDDLEGIFGDPTATGKPSDSDLRERKKSFPLLLAYQRATVRERVQLERLGAGSTAEELSMVKEIVRRRGGISGTRRAIERVLRAARGALEEGSLPPEQAAAVNAMLARFIPGGVAPPDRWSRRTPGRSEP